MMPPYPSMTMSLTGPHEDAEVARAGKPLEDGQTPASVDAVAEALHNVYDPEIPVNVYDLGLIYSVDIDDHGSCAIVMTLTAPGCPVAEILPNEVAQRAASVEGIGEVVVTLTWDPPWTPERMSDVARAALDFF
ncbi:DUF59 domain-containing protein [Phaeovibrio sulfidiphilus]|uniref:DUF59 domain-containing protein n=1 Tax=Phaeovibrio sulfidiphilus TaxID=1220600 RepID=A0A8J6YQU5_9PROT|nr:DUF59 domain-containing protein [Phaeovibrio sulfidiphilus]MBE1237687.1 DUF59 domain-containing protein [Phaeovibrio sulfidiphilus]